MSFDKFSVLSNLKTRSNTIIIYREQKEVMIGYFASSNVSELHSLVKKKPDVYSEDSFPESKWKLDQRWALSCNFCWANVGLAMQNHRHFAHPKNVGQTCCTNVGPTCCTNVGPTCCIKFNVGPTCWANVGFLLVLWKLLAVFVFKFPFSQLFTCYFPCDLSVL